MSARETFRVALRKFEPFESAIQKQWASFQQQTGSPLHLETEALDLHPLYERLFEKQELARGDWDVAFVNTDWLAAANETDALLDIDPWIKRHPPEDYPNGWEPSLLRFQQFGEKVLGLPYHDGPECLIYRKDLFEDGIEQESFYRRFGRPLRVPGTWNEYLEVARFFTRPEKNLFGTVFAAYPDGHNTVYDFCLQLWTRNGELFSAANKVQLNTPQAAEALDYYRTILNDPSAIHPQARSLDSVQAGMTFARGEVALMINWFGFAAMSETISESKVKRRVGIAMIPHAEGCPSASLNVYWVLAIGRGSPHAEVAYEFLRYCASLAMDKLLTLEGGIGCRKSTWEDPEVNEVIPFYHQLTGIHAHAREFPRLSRWSRLAVIIDELMVETIRGQTPVTRLLESAQTKLINRL